MKLYGIWWEEEIPLMCSCNDCSGEKKKQKKKRKEEKKEKKYACLHLNPFKEIKAFESSFFCLYAAPPTPGHSSDSSDAGQGVSHWPWEYQTVMIAGGRRCHGFLCLSFCQKTPMVVVVEEQELLRCYEGGACTSWNMRGGRLRQSSSTVLSRQRWVKTTKRSV